MERKVTKDLLRTIVYVDGFNFYYGQLKGTPWKWLDLPLLFKNILGPQNEIVKVKYFTAKVQPTLSDPQVNIRQDSYFRALDAYCPKIEIHLSHFLRHAVYMENAAPPPNTIQVWKTEEKGSDVNLALHVLNDAWLDLYDCAVIVSNDSDLANSLKFVKEQHKKLIGLVTPGAPKRKTSRQLQAYASFTKPIRTWALEQSLLPDFIPDTTIRKPSRW